MVKQTVLTEKNVRAAASEVGGDSWELAVSPADELVARRIVVDGKEPSPYGGFIDARAPVRGVALRVDQDLPQGVWHIEGAQAPAAPERERPQAGAAIAAVDLAIAELQLLRGRLADLP